MRITPETRLHSWLFATMVAIMVAISGKVIPHLENLKGMSLAGAVLAVLIVSPFGYKLVAQGILSAARGQPWLLKLILRDSYAHGFWYGTIKSSSGSTALAIERYKQSPVGIRIDGESYWPDGVRGAEWRTSSAFVDPEGPDIRAIFQTTVFDDDGNIHRFTGGFGSFRLEKDHITGFVSDKPEKAGDKWQPKTFQYELRRVKSQKVTSFSDVKSTTEWTELCQRFAVNVGPGAAEQANAGDADAV